jgi:hypothetical protein
MGGSGTLLFGEEGSIQLSLGVRGFSLLWCAWKETALSLDVEEKQRDGDAPCPSQFLQSAPSR